MKSYDQLVYKQLKVNKRRNIYTILGIMLGIILFTTVGYLKIFINQVNMEDVKIHNGNYEAYFYDINKSEVKEIENNVLIKNYGLAALESNEYINVGDIKKSLLIYALDNNCINNIFNKSMVLEEGAFPKDKGEVTLDIGIKTQLNKSLGDEIYVGKNKYKIVGFFKGNKYNPYDLNGITYFDNINNYNKLIGFFNVKGNTKVRENIFEIVNDMKINIHSNNELLIEHNNGTGILNLNENLINCYENNEFLNFKNINEVKITFLLVDFGTFFLTIILVLASINISIKERVKYFAILRCIGATPEKIRYLLLKESLTLGFLSIIPALVMAYGITYFIINIILMKIGKMDFYGVKFFPYWSVMITAVLLVGIIILISSILPILRVGKISPIEAIKIGSSTLGKVKIRRGKIIKKIFGYKGMLAYKNIRANNRNFIISTLMLSTLLIILVLFTTFYSIMFKNITGQGLERIKDFTINIDTASVSSEEDNWNSINYIDNQFEKIKNIKKILKETGSVKNISSYVKIDLHAVFKGITTNEDLKPPFENYEEGAYVYIPNNLFVYDDESIREILPYIKSFIGHNITLNDFKDDDVILIKSKSNNKEGLTLNTNNKVKMYLRINNLEANNIEYSKKPIKINVIGTIDSSNIIDGRTLENNNRINLIVSKKFFEKYKKLILRDIEYNGRTSSVDFDFLNKSERLKSLEAIKDYVNEIGGWYEDNYDFVMKSKAELLALGTFVYIIIFFIMCIGIINIINNKNISVSLRKKEFATMLAIGIRKKYLQKIIILEGILQWLLSVVISATISSILVCIGCFVFQYLGENIKVQIVLTSIITFIFGGLIFLIVNLISSIIALRSIEKFNIAEIIRIDE